MYDAPGPVARDRSRERIFAPLSYPVVRSVRVVPVAHVEGLTLAAFFPVVWRESLSGEIDLVVVRSLLADGLGHPPGSQPRSGIALPLVLRGYPFLLDPHQPDPSVVALLSDRVVADQPNDVGAPITDEVGRLSRGTELKIKALQLFSRHLPLTKEMSQCLRESGLLDPWPLTLVEGTSEAKVDRLRVLGPRAYEHGRLRAFFHQFGSAGVILVGSHRLSLFRAGVLVGSARNAIRRMAREGAAGITVQP